MWKEIGAGLRNGSGKYEVREDEVHQLNGVGIKASPVVVGSSSGKWAW